MENVVKVFIIEILNGYMYGYSIFTTEGRVRINADSKLSYTPCYV
jgi:hypothetical protein